MSEKDSKTTTSKRYFYLSGIIDEDSSEELCEKIISLNYENPTEPILIFIDTYGGQVDSIWSIISMIEASYAPVYTYCTSKAVSAGCLIFIAGERRFVGPYARLMMHELYGGCFGRAHEMENDIKEKTRLQKELEKWVAKKTKMNLKEVQEKMKIDFYMTPDEAIKLGFADKKISSFKELKIKGW